MGQPERVGTLADLSLIDAPVGSEVYVDEKQAFYQAHPDVFGSGVPGPADITRVAWRDRHEANLISRRGQWFHDLLAPAAVAYDPRVGVSATGGLVDSIADQSGCGVTGTATLTNRPTSSATAWDDGGPALSFDGVANHLRCDAIAAKLYGLQKRSVLALIKPDAAPNASATIFSTRNAGNQFNSYLSYSTNYGLINSGALVNSAYTASPVFTASRTTLIVFCQDDGAGNSWIYCDGRKFPIAADAFDDLGAQNAAAVGGNLYSGGVTNYFKGLMRFVSVHVGMMSGEEYMAACRNLLGGKYTRIIAAGNSLTQGGFGGGGYYPTTLQAQLGARNLGRFEVTNVGAGGQNTDYMISHYAADALAAYSNVQNNLLIAWELSNQWIGSYPSGGTTRQAVDKLWQYCDQARKDGFSVVAATATYREAAGYVGLPSKQVGDAGIDAMNALVRAEWRNHADALADINAHPYFGNTALTSTFVDGTHLSQAACDVVAGIVAREVNRLIAKLER